MYDNVNDAMQAIVTRKQALDELRKHGADIEEFFEEVGDKPTYVGEEVLGWLGY